MSILNFSSKLQKNDEQSPQKKAKILIAEDEKYLNDFYVELLTGEGYELLSAFNGQEALDIIAKNPPDLVILDINMPVISGNGVLVQLKKNDQTKDIPVIMLTNAGTIENMTDSKIHHANRFFIKSNIEPPKLIEAIKTLLTPQADR